MTRIGRRLIEDFLLPALDNQKYGDLLKWVDKERRYFSIRWSHKNAAKWTLEDTAVFQDWDRLKGHYHPEVKGYYMQAKQRFRAALYKLSTVRKLACEDKHVKKYQLVLDNDKSKGDSIGRNKVKAQRREESQKSIPTSVICKNTSYIAKQPKQEYLEEEPPRSPSPASSVKSENSDKERDECILEYQKAQRRQMILSYSSQHFRRIAPKSPENFHNEKCPTAILRDSPKMNVRTPHVPIQPVPVYTSKSNLRPVDRRFESPRVLLVKTYADDSHEERANLNILPHCMNEQNSDGVLNLSIRPDDCETLSR